MCKSLGKVLDLDIKGLYALSNLEESKYTEFDKAYDEAEKNETFIQLKQEIEKVKSKEEKGFTTIFGGSSIKIGKVTSVEKIEKTKAEKKKTEKAPEQSAKDKAIHLLNQKMNASPDGIIYMNHTDMLTILEAAKADSEGQTAENHAGKPGTKPQAAAGANLDLQV